MLSSIALPTIWNWWVSFPISPRGYPKTKKEIKISIKIKFYTINPHGFDFPLGGINRLIKYNWSGCKFIQVKISKSTTN